LATALSPVLEALYHGRVEDAQREMARIGEQNLTIFEAAAMGATTRVERLLSDDPGLVNAWSSDGFQPLQLAAFFGRHQAAEMLLRNGGDVNTHAQNAFQVTALHAALAGPTPELARTLLDARADVNARQQGDVTPLHEAAHRGSVELTQLLLERGADPNARDARDRTPADVAREGGHSAVVELLEPER
jgi:ankyrin repeat protein